MLSGYSKTLRKYNTTFFQLSRNSKSVRLSAETLETNIILRLKEAFLKENCFRCPLEKKETFSNCFTL